jgi:uncharacterized protein
VKPEISDSASLDHAAILSLNNSNARDTSNLEESSLAALLDIAFYARGIGRGATAFLIALDQNAPYRNVNFNWFKQCRLSFVYIDRIIVAASARGQGVARLLYDDLFVVAKQAAQRRVVCEVNIEPPNPASERFHLAMGFKEVGQAVIDDGTHLVRYLEKTLDDL